MVNVPLICQYLSYIFFKLKKNVMKKLFFPFMLALAFNAIAQTNTFPTTGSAGIGTITPNSSAILDIVSTNRGVLLPRMTIAQRNIIASPATGLLIYQTNSTPGVYYYNGIAWAQISAGKATTNLNNLSLVTAVSQSLLPGVTNNIDLGSATKAWRDLYLSGNTNMGGNLTFTGINNTIQFANTGGSAMVSMFPSGTGNADRMVIQHSPAYPNWGLQYQDATDQFNFLGQGNPVMSVNLYPGSVGIGTATPGAKFDIAGSGTYDLSGSYNDFRLGDATYNLKMGVANAGGGAGDAYLAGSGRLYLGTSNSFANSQTVAINNDGTVGIGGFAANARLGVTGNSTSVQPIISATTTYVGTSDIRGVLAVSKASDGWGIGVDGTGGYIGGYFTSNAGAYTSAGYGVYGVANGSAGTRTGVYGFASGGTVNNWGGYFPTKTYTSELRVGGEKGATGFVACINGKLIATEVRVQPTASWPDYVFGKDYKLMSLEELESKINANKHLPNVPTATDVKENGIMLGEMQTKAMEKIEELTLYLIEIGKQNKELKKEIEALKTLVNTKK